MKWSGSFWFLVVSCWLLVGCNTNQEIALPEQANYNIIPQPQKLTTETGFFTIDENTSISNSLFLLEYLNKLTRINFTIDKTNSNNINISIKDGDESEAYSLNVTENNIQLTSTSAKGISRGLATLKQLIMLNSTDSSYFVPCLKIEDEPRFKHRGLLLDCSRHFFEAAIIKKYIDLLAYYKMNTLHWHLTEDQGWRIAIDKYQKLTEVAAWRTELDGSKYGGFYSKDEIREIVSYAKERHITVIPEIELPGHSQAAIAAYPHLSCTGKQVEVANDWGVFKEIYCAGNDSVFIFLEDVLTEVMELFPSEYIHIGGDEAPKYRWENCAKCQNRIKTEGLKDEHELQSYFISRIEKFLNKNGRQLIGWDEILEGGLSPNATVQSWRGMNGGVEAAESGHQAIMSPTSHCYLDYDLKAIDLEKVYNFDPIPENLAEDKHHFIIGGEVNMWTEHVPDEDNLDSKVFPRLMALSEVLWSYPEKRDYDEFYNRVQSHYPALEYFGVKYGLENNPVKVETIINEGNVYIQANPGNSDLTVHYKWDCDTCSKEYRWAHYELMLEHSGTLSLQAFKNKIEYGNPIEQPFEYHQALTKKVKYNTEFNEWYTAGGEFGLVDGKIGTTDFRDGNWQGFWGKDVDVIIDLEEEKYISQIATNFYQYNNAWIFFPTKVEFYISRDGKHYENVPTLANKTMEPEQRGKLIGTYRTGFERDHIRYIKVKAKNIMKVPDWHEAAGSDAWIFIDEIIVK